jgi:hypothetical protein
VAHAPVEPLRHSNFHGLGRRNKHGVGEQMANGVHADAELRRSVHEATASGTELLSFRLPDGESVIVARNSAAPKLGEEGASGHDQAHVTVPRMPGPGLTVIQTGKPGRQA